MKEEMSLEKIIQQIAKEEGVSPQEVESDMKEAIRESMTSPEPTAQAFWGEFFSDGKEPPIEEFMAAIIAKLIKGE